MNVEAISLQAMEEKDLDLVADNEARSVRFPWSRTNFSDALRSGYDCWTIRQEKDLIGQGVMLHIPDEAHLLILSVVPEHRGKGFGKHLLEHLLKVAGAAGIHHTFLEVRVSNHVAQEMYRKQGFIEIGCRKGYYPASDNMREDAVVMRYDHD